MHAGSTVDVHSLRVAIEILICVIKSKNNIFF